MSEKPQDTRWFDRRALLRGGMVAGFGAAAVIVAGPGIARAATASQASPKATAAPSAVIPGTLSPQYNWAFCDKCKGLYYSGPNNSERASSVCPKDGGTHGGNTNSYVLVHDYSSTNTNVQTNWAFCDKCKGLYYSGPNNSEQASSVCPAGGTHGGNTYNYAMLLYPQGISIPDNPTNTQGDWHFCDKCNGLYYYGTNGSEQASSFCPDGGTHGGNSSNYGVPYLSGTLV